MVWSNTLNTFSLAPTLVTKEQSQNCNYAWKKLFAFLWFALYVGEPYGAIYNKLLCLLFVCHITPYYNSFKRAVMSSACMQLQLHFQDLPSVVTLVLGDYN